MPDREVNVLDRQRVHVNERRRLYFLQRVIRPIAVMRTRLIALEATGVNGTDTSPASLLRAAAEQTAELLHVEFALPAADGRVVRRAVKTEFVENWRHRVEEGFDFSKAFVKFGTEEDDSDLHPLCVPAGAIGRSGFIWVVNVFFGKILTLSGLRSFRPHTARRRPFPVNITKTSQRTVLLRRK